MAKGPGRPDGPLTASESEPLQYRVVTYKREGGGPETLITSIDLADLDAVYQYLRNGIFAVALKDGETHRISVYNLLPCQDTSEYKVTSAFSIIKETGEHQPFTPLERAWVNTAWNIAKPFSKSP